MELLRGVTGNTPVGPFALAPFVATSIGAWCLGNDRGLDVHDDDDDGCISSASVPTTMAMHTVGRQDKGALCLRLVQVVQGGLLLRQWLAGPGGGVSVTSGTRSAAAQCKLFHGAGAGAPQSQHSLT